MSDPSKPQTPREKPLDLESRPDLHQGERKFGNAKKALTAGKAKPVMHPWEVEEAVRWLALTGNCAEVARLLNRPPRTIYNVSTVHEDRIRLLHAELLMGLKDEFDASIRLTHQRYREFLAAIRDPEQLMRDGRGLIMLAEVIGLITDRRSVILGNPGNALPVKGAEETPDADEQWLKAKIAAINEGRQEAAEGEDHA